MAFTQSLYAIPANLRVLFTVARTVGALTVRRNSTTDVPTLQHWVLLRPLVLFLLACPCLVLLVLVGRDTAHRRKKRSRKRSRKANMVWWSAVYEDATSGPDQFHASGEFVPRHTETRPRQASRTVVEDQPIDRTKVTASEELARPRAEAGWPGEWDGGQPRPVGGVGALGQQMNDSLPGSSLGQWPNCGLLALGERMNDSVRRSSLGQRPNCGLLVLGERVNGSLRRPPLGQRPNFGLLALDQQVNDSLPGLALSQQPPATPAADAQSTT